MTCEQSDRSALHEEIRFAKKQQWAITAYVMALLGAAFAIADAAEPPLEVWEKAVGSLFAVIAVGVGCWLLYQLQNHLRDTQLRLNLSDNDPWGRGTEVLYSLEASLFLSCVVVIYFLWR
jgi:hypothetical protein